MAAPGRPRLHREHSGMLPHHQFKAALAESASAPLTSIKNQLADERARRRRHFAASQQPVIFDRFAARAGSPGKESMASEQIPGVSASRAWLEDDAGSAGSGDPEAAEAAAVAKIKKAAIFFDRSYASSRESFRAAFEAPNLDSAQLAEMGAGEIDGPAFVRFFFRCGFEARTEERTRRWEAAAENDRERERSHQRVLDRDEAERRRTVTAPYTARDEENAWTKLAKVAKNKGLQGDLVSRAAFESLMTPAEIKLQLKKSYNIDMTHAEMGAICGRFDKNASGQINGAEFQYEWSHAEAGPEEGGGFIDDGTARRGSVTRLSFGMAKIGAKTSDPGKVLRRRTPPRRLHKFAAKPELPGQIARLPRRAARRRPLRARAGAAARRDYGGDFRAMLLDAGREKRGADALGRGPRRRESGEAARRAARTRGL
ncbi:hypothetical protein JL721_4702 [Aureococcus anophagefferens]|nr:hypothetical protein JL721_4702 [Aureococcus anophagefferens]